MHVRLWLAIFLVALCLPALTLGQPSSDKGDKGPLDEGKIRKKLLDGKYLQGVVIDRDLDGAEKTMTLKVDWETKTPNAEGEKRYAELYKQYRQTKDRNQLQQLYVQLVDANKARYDIEKTPYEFKLKFTADTKVRREKPAPKDPDHPEVKYTTAELTKLKGPGNVAGYPADPAKDIDTNDTLVQITIDKSKFKDKEKPSDKDKPADKDKAAEAPGPNDVYIVTMVMIVYGKEVAVNPFK